MTAQLKAVYEQERTMRADSTVPAERLALFSARHREDVYELLSQAVITEPEDLMRAAFILHNADLEHCRETHLLAHHLALAAVEQGYDDGRFLAALTLDRFLLACGVPQRYGTQYDIDSEGQVALLPFDTATTDEERAKWGVPSLDSLAAGLAPEAGI